MSKSPYQMIIHIFIRDLDPFSPLFSAKKILNTIFKKVNRTGRQETMKYVWIEMHRLNRTKRENVSYIWLSPTFSTTHISWYSYFHLHEVDKCAWILSLRKKKKKTRTSTQWKTLLIGRVAVRVFIPDSTRFCNSCWKINTFGGKFYKLTKVYCCT